MSATEFRDHLVTTEAQLVEIFGVPSGNALTKEIDHINAPYRALIEAAPFFALATCGQEGMDCSPRGDAPGFVRVHDEHTLLIPDLNSSQSFECLAETLHVYLIWRNTSAGSLQKLVEPVRIDSTSWWGTTGFEHDDFTVTVTYDPPLDEECHACPEGEGLGTSILNSDGTLIVEDLNFGGIGSNTRIELRAMHPDPDSALVRVIALQWDNPGTYFDAELEQNVNAAPDGTNAGIVTMSKRIMLDSSLAAPFDTLSVLLRLPTRIVEWVSTDIVGSDTLRVVEESDLVTLSDELGNSVVWGFGSETRNYHVNVNMFGTSALYIDASDLAMMAADLDDDCTGSSKMTMGGLATGETRKEKILEWFGIAPTGEMVVGGPGGKLIPGYEVVDWEQNRRAIADPYGWREQ